MASPKETAVDSKSPLQQNETIPKENDIKQEVAVTISELGPPPRPAPAGSNDYFSATHGHLSSETNPFEFSFAGNNRGGPSEGNTPGGTKLPSVAALTSPVGLNGGITPGFWGGLRSGPLSPAMLSGPQKDDYFGDGHHLRGGFPTPNESGMRSGLTPGGGGSMFPDQPSPNTAALFQNLTNGVATPGTLEFQRTALSIASKGMSRPPQQNITSQPQNLPNMSNGMDVKPPQTQGHFDQHDANDAANGLFLLANAPRNGQPTSHYAMANQAPVHAHPQAMHMQMGDQSVETSPIMGHRNGGSISSSVRQESEASNGYEEEHQPQSRPNTRGKGKRASQDTQTNGRKKAADAPAKGHASKKSKGNNGRAMSMDPPSEDEQLDLTKDEYNANGKKMTDEEKRKNFLERNRVAALKCRQRKKQWLANLQQKVELYTAENDSLNAQVTQLRDEVVNLKTILLAHKDCPIGQQQGLQSLALQPGQMMEGQFGQGPMNPYTMAAGMQHHQQQQQQNGMYGPPPPNMQRRSS